MKEKLKELMLKHITLKNGLSSSDLVHKIMSEIGPMAFTNDEFHEAYEELLDQKEMLAIEYTDPDSTRSKTILFTRGTSITKIDVELSDGQRSTTSQTDVARASN